MSTERETNGASALQGMKVVAFAHVIAVPMAAAFLADFGADVVHVEPPGRGDASRQMGLEKDGVYLWWKVLGRNKRSVTLDLRRPEGRAVAHRLASWADVVITNFRPGTLEHWGISWEILHEINPKLIYLQISGFGRDGPKSEEPGFGKIGEARSGVVYITGFQETPPVHTAFSHADAVAGLMGAFGVMTAMHRKSNDPTFRGELVDIALFEPLFRLIEWQVIGYDQLGTIFERAGNRMPVAPAAIVNTYMTKDNEWITVSCGTAASVLKVVDMLGLPRQEFESAEDQFAATDLLDQRMREWVAQNSTDDALARMRGAEVVASRIFNIKDIVEDEVYRHREAIVALNDPDLGQVRMQAALPKLTNYPGKVWRTGPALGQDNDLVYRDWLQMPEMEYEGLKRLGVI